MSVVSDSVTWLSVPQELGPITVLGFDDAHRTAIVSVRGGEPVLLSRAMRAGWDNGEDLINEDQYDKIYETLREILYPESLSLAEWDESKYKRDDNGRFTSNGSGGTSTRQRAQTPTSLLNKFGPHVDEVINIAHGLSTLSGRLLDVAPASESLVKVTVESDDGTIRSLLVGENAKIGKFAAPVSDVKTYNDNREARWVELGMHKPFKSESRKAWNKTAPTPPPPITPMEKRAIISYSQDSRDLNSFLWRSDPGVWESQTENSVNSLKKQAKLISNLVEKHGKPREVIRVVPPHLGDQVIARYKELYETGQDSIEKGVTSTSGCVNCFDSGGKVIMRIKAKKALSLAGGLSTLPYEREYVLRPGTRLRVLKIQDENESEFGRTTVHLEELDDSDMSLAEWDESKHPRDADGKFTSGPGSKGATKKFSGVLKKIYETLSPTLGKKISINKANGKVYKGRLIDITKKTDKSMWLTLEQPDGKIKKYAVGPKTNVTSTDFKSGSKQEAKSQSKPNSTQETSIPSKSQMTLVKTLGGSTGAELYKDKRGDKYVVKAGDHPKHIKEEYTANKMYKAAGVQVPDVAFKDGEQIAKFVDGTNISKFYKDKNVLKKAASGFAADALFANWDVVGMHGDNMLVDKNGTVYRIDNGGALRYSALGFPKSAAFGSVVYELHTMRDAKFPAGKVFHVLSDEDVAKQIDDLLKNRAKILAQTDDKALKATLNERMNYMENWAKQVKALSNVKTFDDKGKGKDKGSRSSKPYVPIGHKVIDHFGANIGKHLKYTQKKTGKTFEGKIVAVDYTKSKSKSSALVTLETASGKKTQVILGQTAASQALLTGRSSKETGVASVSAVKQYKTDRLERKKQLFPAKFKTNKDAYHNGQPKPPPPIPNTHRSALRRYTGSWAFTVNKELWHNNGEHKPYSKNAKTSNTLSKFIQNHGVPMDVIRAVPAAYAQETLQRYEKLLETGQDSIELGFLSTTVKRGVFGALETASVTLRIAAKKALCTKNNSKHPSEYEYVIDKGSKMRVLDIEYGPKTFTGKKTAIVYLEQIE